MPNALRKVEDHKNHVRSMYLTTVLNMGNRRKYARKYGIYALITFIAWGLNAESSPYNPCKEITHFYLTLFRSHYIFSIKINNKATRSPAISRQQVQKLTDPPLSTSFTEICQVELSPPPPPPLNLIAFLRNTSIMIYTWTKHARRYIISENLILRHIWRIMRPPLLMKHDRNRL